jgi:hypothetical protein
MPDPAIRQRTPAEILAHVAERLREQPDATALLAHSLTLDMVAEELAAGQGAAAHQWRIRIDGYPNSGCWIDAADGDFQNLNVVGRLEFRAKPGAFAGTDAEDA